MANFNPLEFSSISPKIPNLDFKNHNLADAFYDRLISLIISFEKNLNLDEEVGARLVSFGETIIIHIDDLGYWNPSLIYFYGRDNSDREVQLIQHISQISILLMKVPRTNPDRERIGFKLQKQQDEKNDSEE